MPFQFLAIALVAAQLLYDRAPRSTGHPPAFHTSSVRILSAPTATQIFPSRREPTPATPWLHDHDLLAQGAGRLTASENVPETRPLSIRVAESLRRWGAWAPPAFIILFVITTVLCIPGAFLTLAGGFLFGPVLGFVLVWIASLIGASAAFGISRHLARDWILRRLAGRPLLLAVEQAVSEEGWKIVALSRLAPGSPFFLLNYLYGLTRVRFRDYFWATAFSMIPGSFLLVYLGSLGQLALTGRIRSPLEWALYGAGLLALAGCVLLIARRANRVLKQKLSPHPPKPPR